MPKININGSTYNKTSGPALYESMQPDGTPWPSVAAAHAGAIYKGISHVRLISIGGVMTEYWYVGGTDLVHLVPKYGGEGPISANGPYSKVGVSLPYENIGANSGNATNGIPRIFFGDNTPSGDNACILVGRNLTGTNLFVHAFRDESTMDSDVTGAYASFDAIPAVVGDLPVYNHLHAFQARPSFLGTGSIDQIVAFISGINVSSGVASNIFTLKVINANGSGVVTNQYGIWIDPLTKGTAGNFAIYSVDVNTPSYHAGVWQTGNDILAAGNINGANLKVNNGANNASLGIGTPIDTVSNPAGFYLVLIGHNAGTNLQAATTLYNTFVGARSGESMVTGNSNTFIGSYSGNANLGTGNVFIGANAGKYATGSNKFIVDNKDRADAATENSNALVIGEFATAPANQKLKVNGTLSVGFTGDYADNAAAITAGLAVGTIYRTGDLLKIVH